MFAKKRIRLAAAALTLALAAGGVGAGMAATASASATSGQSSANHPKLNLNRFDLNGYVINADYTLGRNTGNTFQQTYTSSSVQGVPIAGPNVGVTFPPANYVALSIGPHELYITWLDPTNAIIDVFVMNFVKHTVYDYAPGSSTPESAGTITVVKSGPNRIP
ncbi:MAG TPA: hypothetical protein VH589_10565 [Trebonia sp.]|jgi:hypothetical protein